MTVLALRTTHGYPRKQSSASASGGFSAAAVAGAPDEVPFSRLGSGLAGVGSVGEWAALLAGGCLKRRGSQTRRCCWGMCLPLEHLKLTQCLVEHFLHKCLQ
jgi:hypothetical protein